MKNTTLLAIIGIVIVLIVGFMFINGKNDSITGSSIVNTKDIQVVKLSVSGNSYVLEPTQLKKNVPIRIEADMTKMPGCSKSVVISAFGISKTFTSSDNTLEFTPNKAGTFNIACSMNMYRGSFEVLESDGTSSSYTEPSKASSSSTCSMKNGGSCGCGG